MKLIKTEEAVGHVLCHDMTQIIPGVYKDARFRKGHIVTYGAPVLPGAMFCLGYFDDGTPVVGLPGCVMYAKTTIFDVALPRLAADVPMTRDDFTRMGNGGLCLGCETCRFPVCSLGMG